MYIYIYTHIYVYIYLYTHMHRGTRKKDIRKYTEGQERAYIYIEVWDGFEQ